MALRQSEALTCKVVLSLVCLHALHHAPSKQATPLSSPPHLLSSLSSIRISPLVRYTASSMESNR